MALHRRPIAFVVLTNSSIVAAKLVMGHTAVRTRRHQRVVAFIAAVAVALPRRCRAVAVP